MVQQKIIAEFFGETISSNSQLGFSLYEKSLFGEKSGQKIEYSFCEILFLVEKGKMEVYTKKTFLDFSLLLKKLQRLDKRISVKYKVFRDLREKGYIVKTALKFGADFRVYDKGKRPGTAHAKWIVFSEHESKSTSWQEFSSKNRVAHSTKKSLLLAIVDEEGDITYYNVHWIKP